MCKIILPVVTRFVKFAEVRRGRGKSPACRGAKMVQGNETPEQSGVLLCTQRVCVPKTNGKELVDAIFHQLTLQEEL